MNDDRNNTAEGIDVNQSKVDKLTYRLIIKERNNIRTKELNDAQMQKWIKDRIEEVAECY